MAESADPTARDAQKAVELSPDVDAEQIGRVYAQALLGAATGAAQTASVVEELDSLVVDVLAKFPKLEFTLGSLLVSHEEKSGILDRVFGGRATPLMLNFLKVVSRHGRLDCLRAIQRQARRLYEQSQGRVHVRLSTASPLEPAMVAQITANLRAMLGREPVVDATVDPELIGGAVLRVGDTVYDGSVANQLLSVRQQMIDRSVHEIQSRRDRFRYPAGS